MSKKKKKNKDDYRQYMEGLSNKQLKDLVKKGEVYKPNS